MSIGSECHTCECNDENYFFHNKSSKINERILDYPLLPPLREPPPLDPLEDLEEPPHLENPLLLEDDDGLLKEGLDLDELGLVAGREDGLLAGLADP